MFRELKNPKEKLASGEKIDICMVSTLTMTKLCKDLGTPAFMISMADLILLQATATDTLDSIPAKYHDFHDVFSGEKVGTLTPHRPYDLQINIKEGAKPIHRPIYSLCQGASETGNVSCPSAHGTPTDLWNRHSRGWVPAECLEQKMLYEYATVCTQGHFTLSRK